MSGLIFAAGRASGRRGPELHLHSAEEFFYIVRGKGVGEIGGQEVTLEAGLAMYVPAHIAHNFTYTGDSNLEILYFMSEKHFTTTPL